jgi:glucose-1-phosphate thymidylyltransferase
VENCEIEHSIVLENTILKDIDVRIADSLIGRNVEVYRAPRMPKAIKLTLGDNSKVGLI